MQKGDFFESLKKHVEIDEKFGFRFVKIQQNVKQGFFLVHFESGLLPPALFLEIEQYVKKTVGSATRVAVAYRDIGEAAPEAIAAHIEALCCRVRPAVTPFVTQAKIRLERGVMHIDFADDFGREIFAASGLVEYIGDYLTRCFGGDIRVVTGRHHEGRSSSGLEEAKKRLLQMQPQAPPQQSREPEEPVRKKPSGVIHGKQPAGEVMDIRDIDERTGLAVVCGNVLDVKSFDIRNEARGKKAILVFGVTDFTSTITCKAFVGQAKCEALKKKLTQADAVKVAGRAGYDSYSREVVLMISGIEHAQALRRQDNAAEKRVELHMHTNMSALDGVADEKDIVNRAADFEHEAVAITDHGVVQAFPGAFDVSKKRGIKVIYGMEAYMIDDQPDVFVEQFEDEYVVFDLETTGLNPGESGITEIGAVRLRRGEVVDSFSTFVNPGMPISAQITKLTGITNGMVKDAPGMGEALAQFKQYIGDAHLAAHNAAFDMGFLKKHGEDAGIAFDNPCMDTVGLFTRALPGHRSYSLGKLAADLGISLRHHRAKDDAACTAQILTMAMEALTRRQGQRTAVDEKSLKSFHVVLLCKNKQGLRNLYRLVSESHMNHFYRNPRVPKSLIETHREGLLVGSACEAGELVRGILRYAPDEELQHIAKFYDYLEVMPDGNNEFLVREGRLRNMEAVRDLTRKIVALGEAAGIPVAATCDAHFIEPRDEVFRRILQHGQGFEDADHQAPLYFRTTDEMLREFSYLGEQKAREVVVENTRAIAAAVEPIELLPSEPAMPVIDGAAEKLEQMAHENARARYGDPLPDIVRERLDYELSSIIKHGYGVLYYIAYELVKHSMEDGYLVGSRGSVGSSFAATMAGITEVNPLPPHYVCPECRYSDFDVNTDRYACGPDLPEKDCPVCGRALGREGFDIPFAVFLGINADKVPDIDLNFSGEYQPRAHQFTVDYFGKDRVFRAGTINSIAKQTAFGFVKGYMNDHNMVVSKAEVERLADGVCGTKRTTGQHPGGLVILPKGRDINEFTPIQRPANDVNSDHVTTHYNFDSLHDRLIKLDILGHDDPTALHMLQRLTGIDPKEVPLADPETLSLFSSLKSLHIRPDQILGCEVGSLGIPEFGTRFVRQMLLDTMPTTIGELIRISGLSHGTDVWLNNAQTLIKSGRANLRQVICTRDDIMNYLVHKGMDETESFYIMESVRRGRGLNKEWQQAMQAAGVPAWFIDSCKKIKYMFPKAHAVAYVTMALRIAYFKVHHPLAFYATYFSVRADNLDASLLHSAAAVRKSIADIEALGKDATALDQSQLTILEIALEMMERGIDFLPCDLYASQAGECVIEDGSIRLPFTALAGTGEAAANGIVAARAQGDFISVEDLKSRAGISSAVIGKLEEYGCLEGLAKSNQMSLFDIPEDD